MATDEITSRTGKTWLDARHGIIRFEAFRGVEQEKEDAVENIDAILRICQGKKYPLLVDLARSKGLGQEAREYYGGPVARTSYTALALIGSSPISRMLGNMWFAIYGDRDAPTKIFGSEAEAIEWLKGFR